MATSPTLTVARPIPAGVLHILHPETMRAICNRPHPPASERKMRKSQPRTISGDTLQYEHRVCRRCWRRYEIVTAMLAKTIA